MALKYFYALDYQTLQRDKSFIVVHWVRLVGEHFLYWRAKLYTNIMTGRNKWVISLDVFVGISFYLVCLIDWMDFISWWEIIHYYWLYYFSILVVDYLEHQITFYRQDYFSLLRMNRWSLDIINYYVSSSTSS